MHTSPRDLLKSADEVTRRLQFPSQGTNIAGEDPPYLSAIRKPQNLTIFSRFDPKGKYRC